MNIIAHIENDFDTKFGVPRQSGLVEAVESRIVFEQEYRNAEALRGLNGFSHLWLIWDFSEAHRNQWSPTVRPPRLGGNKRMGVFATRSPFRPNPLGLSSVRITRIELQTPRGPIIHVSGADLMNGTPILDIKPYLPHIDSHPEARAGFAEATAEQDELKVEGLEKLRNRLNEQQINALRTILASDPRPHYHNDANRIYGLTFGGTDIKFKVNDKKIIITE